MNKLLQTNLKGLKHVARLNKRLLPAIAINQLFENLAPYVNLYMSAEIVNELVGGRNINRLTVLVLFTIAADLLIVLFKGLMNKFRDYQQQEFDNAEKRLFMDYGFKMDYSHLENPEIQQHRAKIDASANINLLGIQSMLNSFQNIASGVIKLILSMVFVSSMFVMTVKNHTGAVGIIIFPVAIILLITLSTFMSIRVAKRLAEDYNGLSNTMIGITRISRGFPDRYQMGKDIRVYNMHEIIGKQRIESRKAHATMLRKLMFGNEKARIPVNIIAQALNFAVYAFVCLNAVRGLFDVGGVIKYVGFISRLLESINSLLMNSSTLETNLPFLEHYLEFFEIDNKMYLGTIPVEKRKDNEYEIEFHDVSFKYSGRETYALKNLSMKLNIGQRMAVVGQNGSGKTTMIKLLCRLYDPTEGVITLNGIDIKKYDYEEYLGIFSVVFQDFKLFSFTLGQNVAAAVHYDADEIKKRLSMAGFADRLKNMKDGLETPLYKDFEEDGVEISGGEAQKISIARALYKNSPFIILDEPTAALDPIAEYEIYSNFSEIVGDKTAVYISHRLSSCRFCDDIAVFNEGTLVQRGSHETLLGNENGKYHELWHAQAQYYNENPAV